MQHAGKTVQHATAYHSHDNGNWRVPYTIKQQQNQILQLHIYTMAISVHMSMSTNTNNTFSKHMSRLTIVRFSFFTTWGLKGWKQCAGFSEIPLQYWLLFLVQINTKLETRSVENSVEKGFRITIKYLDLVDLGISGRHCCWVGRHSYLILLFLSITIYICCVCALFFLK